MFTANTSLSALILTLRNLLQTVQKPVSVLVIVPGHRRAPARVTSYGPQTAYSSGACAAGHEFARYHMIPSFPYRYTGTLQAADPTLQ